jgi:hypothetical protein
MYKYTNKFNAYTTYSNNIYIDKLEKWIYIYIHYEIYWIIIE